jgi:hypothetical protein
LIDVVSGSFGPWLSGSFGEQPLLLVVTGSLKLSSSC